MSERFEITFSEGGVGLIETLATGGLAVVAEKTMDAVSGNDNHGWYCTIKDTVTQISVKCWGSSKVEAQEKSFEEIKRKIEDREDELEREIADIKQREDNALRQRNEQKRETPSSSHGSSSDENGCLKIIVYIVLIIGAIALAIWLAVNIVLPVTLLNSALIFTILALVFKKQKVLFAILALLGGGYMMLDILNGWFSLSFIENVVKDSTWISVFVYLNAIALGIATFLLVWPLWGKSKLLEGSQKGKSALLKILMFLIIAVGISSMPLIYQFIEKPFDSIKQSTEINGMSSSQSVNVNNTNSNIHKLTIIIKKDGKVHLVFDNPNDRLMALENIGKDCNISFTDLQKQSILEQPIIGVPIGHIQSFLDMRKEDQDKALVELGIPTDPSNNQYRNWISFLIDTKQSWSIIVKVNSGAPESAISSVTQTLQDFKLGKYSIVTN